MKTDEYGTHVPANPQEHHAYLADYYTRKADECADPDSPKARMMRRKADAHKRASRG